MRYRIATLDDLATLVVLNRQLVEDYAIELEIGASADQSLGVGEHDRSAWDQQVAVGNPWTRPVDAAMIEQERLLEQGRPLGFSHTLEEPVGGQTEAGFVITGLYEDAHPPEQKDLLSAYMPIFVATRAEKPGQGPIRAFQA